MIRIPVAEGSDVSFTRDTSGVGAAGVKPPALSSKRKFLAFPARGLQEGDGFKRMVAAGRRTNDSTVVFGSRGRNQRLRDEVAALWIENAALRGENASLRKRLDKLQAALEA
jgi:hypothetical protein